jgi:8-oxo-dGTP pyrophosphatase MutT (NUDIX family)
VSAESPIERIEREEFARGHRESGAPPVEPRPASTILLARPAKSGAPTSAFEILLLRRPDTSRFAAGAYVFPGGVIDRADGAPEVVAALPEEHRGSDGPALVAALRELFEETNILLADEPLPAAATAAGALARNRARLLADESSFAEMAAELGLTFRTLDILYFSRWITPVQLARRYDTRFFFVVSERGKPELTPELTDEHTAHTWTSPGDALDRFAAGELPMLFPTWRTLETLAGLQTLAAVIGAFQDRAVEPILAKLDISGGRFRPLMPGDPGYEEAE